MPQKLERVGYATPGREPKHLNNEACTLEGISGRPMLPRTDILKAIIFQ